MTTRSFQFASSEFYHVYNRGVEKRAIFLDVHDYRRFVELLYVANTAKPTDLRSITRSHVSVYEWKRGDPLVAIGAYCLMPNHFHILLTPLAEHGVSQFMNKLGTSYSMYFNRKYKRTGALFEGKFKAQHAHDDAYLKYLFAYIHLNPVKLIQSDWKDKGIRDARSAFAYVRQYQYSSFSDVFNEKRPQGTILQSGAFPEYFMSIKEHENELLEWLKFAEQTKPCK